jgi:hypothetical protein
MFSIIDAVTSKFRTGVRVPRAAIFTFPPSFNLTIEATVKGVVVTILTFMESVVVSESVFTLTCTNGRRGRCFLTASPRRFDYSLAVSTVAVK